MRLLRSTAVATPSKKGPQAAAPSQRRARTPPVRCTSSVYTVPAAGAIEPSGNTQRVSGLVSLPQP